MKTAAAYLEDGIYPKEYDCQILKEIDYTLKYYELKPSVYLAYDRKAYIVKDDPEILSEMGKVLFNIMLYGYDRNNDSLAFNYRDMRSLYGMLRQDVDSSYINYFKRVENGKKGGRPKTETE